MQALNETETKIIKMINIMRKDQRKRPCFSDIFEGINKGADDLSKTDISIFKDTMTKLQDDQVIYDGGRGGKESFDVNDDKVTNVNIDYDSNINGDDSQLYNYINDKFYNSLINIIKTEVKNECKTLINNQMLNTQVENPVKKTDNDIVNSLKSEIEFLRSELTSKSKVIELLIKDKWAENKTSGYSGIDDPFVYPRKTSRAKNIYTDKSNIIKI